MARQAHTGTCGKGVAFLWGGVKLTRIKNRLLQRGARKKKRLKKGDSSTTVCNKTASGGSGIRRNDRPSRLGRKNQGGARGVSPPLSGGMVSGSVGGRCKTQKKGGELKQSEKANSCGLGEAGLQLTPVNTVQEKTSCGARQTTKLHYEQNLMGACPQPRERRRP